MPETFDPSWEYYEPDPEILELLEESQSKCRNIDTLFHFLHHDPVNNQTASFRTFKRSQNERGPHLTDWNKKYPPIPGVVNPCTFCKKEIPRYYPGRFYCSPKCCESVSHWRWRLRHKGMKESEILELEQQFGFKRYDARFHFRHRPPKLKLPRPMTATCHRCGAKAPKSFTHNAIPYCSIQCALIPYYAKKFPLQPGIKKPCIRCRKELDSNRGPTARYCSDKCLRNAVTLRTLYRQRGASPEKIRELFW